MQKDYSHLRIGVLALQGAVSEHIAQIQQLGAKAVAIKQVDELAQLDGLVLPGGESTAMAKLMAAKNFVPALQAFARSGKALFGTCAGMILLAKTLYEDDTKHLALMDICVKRNAFGRQIDSFVVDLPVKSFATSFPAVFIRAPHIVSVGEHVDVLASFEGNPVLAKQENLLACAFHPELTTDARIMQLFLEMC